MKAKQYLMQIKILNQNIDVKREQIQALRDLATKITYTMKQDIVQTSCRNDKISDAVEKIVDLEGELLVDLERMGELVLEITQKIEMIPDDELRNILISKYISMMTFEQIAEKRNFSTRWVYETHQRAIKAFEVVLSIAK